MAIFGQKASDIRAKPRDCWASDGENIRRARDLRLPQNILVPYTPICLNRAHKSSFIIHLIWVYARLGVKISEVIMSEVKMPEVKMSEVIMSEVIMSEIKMSKVKCQR